MKSGEENPVSPSSRELSVSMDRSNDWDLALTGETLPDFRASKLAIALATEAIAGLEDFRAARCSVKDVEGVWSVCRWRRTLCLLIRALGSSETGRVITKGSVRKPSSGESGRESE